VYVYIYIYMYDCIYILRCLYIYVDLQVDDLREVVMVHPPRSEQPSRAFAPRHGGGHQAGASAAASFPPNGPTPFLRLDYSQA